MAFDFLLGCFGWRPSKMPKADENSTQVWLYSLKILFIVPIGIAAFESRKVYNTVKAIPEIQRPPYDEHVLLAHGLTYAATMSIFAWLFSSALFLFFNKNKLTGPKILIFGLIDLSLALILAVGVGFQGNYLPGTSSGCKKAQTWQTNGGDHKSFFVVIAENSGHITDTAKGECEWFVSAWAQAVASLSFQLLIAYVGVFYDEREHSLLNPFRPLFYLILAFIAPPFWIHSHITPKLRFAYHYLVKLSRRTRVEKLEFPIVVTYTPHYDHISISNPQLQRILTIEHVLLNLVDYLHYEDVINFSLTSKAVREAVFPYHDLAYRLPKLKSRVCIPDSKKPCLYCNKSICFSCKATRFYPGLPGRRHVEQCQPYCSKCYYASFSRHARGWKKPCDCTKTDRNLEFQQICRTCVDKDVAMLREKRYLRYQQEARDIAKGKGLPAGEKVKCGNCKKDLKDGTRWWVCGKCKGECRDSIHPPYVKRKKSVDVEMGEKPEGEEQETEASKWSKWVALFRNT